MGVTQRLGTIPLAIFTDASNNVGIGGSPSGSFKFDVTGTGRFTGALTGLSATFNGGTNAVDVLGSIRTDGASNGINLRNGFTATITNPNNNTRDIRFDQDVTGTVMFKANGNVGIGTSSPSSITGAINLITRGISGSELSYVQAASFDGLASIGLYSGVNSTDNPSIIFQNSLRFATATSLGTGGYAERMRITSDGKVGIGVTPSDFFAVQNGSGGANLINFYNTAAAGYGITVRVNNNSSNTYRYFEGVDNGGTQRIAIYTNGDVKNTNNSYGVLSDIKLKENIVDATPKLDKLMQIRVVNYNLKGEDLKQIGVIAQEVEEIFPGLIDECTDTKTDEETGQIIDLGTTTKSVKMSVFVPMLIKAIQELSAKVSALENKS
jgi:hypothetical protein